MSHLVIWIHTPLAQTLGWTLAHFLWEGAVLAALLLAVLRIFRHAPARRRYALACTILAAMPLAFAVTFAVLWARQPAPVPPAPIVENLMLANVTSLPVPTMAPPPARFTLAGLLDRLAWLVPCWFAGVLFFYGRGVAGWVAVQRLRRRGVCAVAPAWQARLEELAERMRLTRPVQLLESCLTDTPVLIGYWRPVVLLPVGCLTGLSASQVECILLHELAHIGRHDYLVNLLQSAVEGLLFYHPAVWWVSRVVRAERENCCDDAVVEVMGDARSYAAALANLERRRAPMPQAALAATGGNLMKRIRRLTMESRKAQTSAVPAVSAGLLLVVFAAGLAAVPAKLPRARHLRNSMPATAVQGADAYTRWINEEVPYIITRAERDEFRALTTDAERKAFIDQFWKRRDPVPATPENEFQVEHYRRLAYVNARFGDGRLPGWKTDRGRIYITYGAPDEIDDHSAGTASAPPSQQWRYRYIEGVGENVIIEFVDSTRNGEFRMTMDPSEKQAAQAPQMALAAKPQATANTAQERQPMVTPYRKWINEDVAYIITEEERAAFTRMQSDQEREGFVAAFWKHRDPTPDTELNEYEVEHYRRIAYANDQFSTSIPGWKTDRGRAYIICGAPDSINSISPRSMTWIYRFIEGAGNNVRLEFEDQTGHGDFHLVNPPPLLAAPPQADQEAKVFVAPKDLAVSVIVSGRGHASGVIGVGDILEVTAQPDISRVQTVRNQNLVSLEQMIANKNSECNALLDHYQPAYPAVAACSEQKAALQRRRDQIMQSEGVSGAQASLVNFKNEELVIQAEIQASAVAVADQTRHAKDLAGRSNEARERVAGSPPIFQKLQALKTELDTARDRHDEAVKQGDAAAQIAEQAKAAAAAVKLAEFEKQNQGSLPENLQAEMTAIRAMNSQLVNLNDKISLEQQRQALLESQLANNRGRQAQLSAMIGLQSFHTNVTVGPDGKVALPSGQLMAVGLTAAQVETALGPNASVQIKQAATDKGQSVTFLVPLENATGHFHVFGQVTRLPGKKAVAAFDQDDTQQPAVAASLQLQPGSYHLTVIARDMTKKTDRKSELDFTVN